MHNNQTNFRGKLIISRHGDFYETYHKLNTIIINGNNNMLDASNMKLSADMALVNARINMLYNYFKLKYITNTL